mmetsp:Transcript_15587/g.39834  ORF Transcript_15587/g.39834 Transcript_15587/m.39834 type:complete len:211 (+) Transcript_15587:2378-3010(+)
MLLGGAPRTIRVWACRQARISTRVIVKVVGTRFHGNTRWHARVSVTRDVNGGGVGEESEAGDGTGVEREARRGLQLRAVDGGEAVQPAALVVDALTRSTAHKPGKVPRGIPHGQRLVRARKEHRQAHQLCGGLPAAPRRGAQGGVQLPQHFSLHRALAAKLGGHEHPCLCAVCVAVRLQVRPAHGRLPRPHLALPQLRGCRPHPHVQHAG